MTTILSLKKVQEKRRSLRKNMTRAEIILWNEMKDKKLEIRILRQYSVFNFAVDFYVPELRLAIEVDGATHVTEEQIKYDLQRQKKIESTKITFLRFTNPEIYYDLQSVLDTIRKKIAELKLNSKTPDRKKP